MFGLTLCERKSFDLFDAFHDFEKDFFAGNMPINSCRTDIRDDGDKFVLEAELPGFDKSDINLDINGNYLILSAEHNTESEDKSKNGNYICRERSFGSYQRSFDISAVKADEINAEYKNGVLTVALPKKTESSPGIKRLEIK